MKEIFAFMLGYATAVLNVALVFFTVHFLETRKNKKEKVNIWGGK